LSTLTAADAASFPRRAIAWDRPASTEARQNAHAALPLYLEARHETHEIVLDAYGFARNPADEIEEAGVPLRRLETSEATAACATLISLIGEDQLRHLDDPDLVRALEGTDETDSPARRYSAEVVGRRHQ
jgi:hypothetical protein